MHLLCALCLLRDKWKVAAKTEAKECNRLPEFVFSYISMYFSPQNEVIVNNFPRFSFSLFCLLYAKPHLDRGCLFILFVAECGSNWLILVMNKQSRGITQMNSSGNWVSIFLPIFLGDWSIKHLRSAHRFSFCHNLMKTLTWTCCER